MHSESQPTTYRLDQLSDWMEAHLSKQFENAYVTTPGTSRVTVYATEQPEILRLVGSKEMPSAVRFRIRFEAEILSTITREALLKHPELRSEFGVAHTAPLDAATYSHLTVGLTDTRDLEIPIDDNGILSETAVLLPCDEGSDSRTAKS